MPNPKELHVCAGVVAVRSARSRRPRSLPFLSGSSCARRVAGREARAGIGEWMIFYNTRRFHQSLGYKTPMDVCAPNM